MKSILLVFLVAVGVHAQDLQDFFPGGSYDPNVPSPSSVLGYRIGERFTSYAALNGYFEKLISSSDRIRRVVYGQTYENRELQALIISSPKNLIRLNEIKRANKRLTDPSSLTSKNEAEQILTSIPIIVYLSYGVHGNEASSPEAAMMTAYQLCAGTDARTQSILDSALIIIDPNVNPDGRERYVQWVNSTVGARPNPSPVSIEHSEPWPGGRTNHFFFDLNRDLSWQTQKETQERVQFYRDWMPHVHVDYHEMEYSGTYFFFPAAVPVHGLFLLKS